jgi:glycosyltransferase involved in cell wall biosynthesis
MQLHGAELESRLAEVRAGRVPLAVWGANAWAALALRQFDVEAGLYLDGDWTRWGSEHQGRPVMSPTWLDSPQARGCLVMTVCGVAEADEKIAAFLAQRPQVDCFQPIHPPDRRAARAARWIAPDAAAGGDLLVVEKLYAGGAERQLGLLADGLVQLGRRAEVAVLDGGPGTAWHYVRDIRAAGAGFDVVAPLSGEGLLDLFDSLSPAAQAFARHVPYFLLAGALRLLERLRQAPPRLLVCHLDRPNVMGAVAGILAGTPHVLMSGRNVCPVHFPHFYRGQIDHFRNLYHMVLGLPGMAFAANSPDGARSYARWLGLTEGDVPVVENAVDGRVFKPLPKARRRAVRALFGLPETAPLILGVFRLAPEKRPLLFVEVLADIMARRPEVHAALCGDGGLSEAVRGAVEAAGLGGRIHLIAQAPNVAQMMGCADLMLHVSEFEGTPNAILEALCSGLPVVCSNDSGADRVLPAEMAEMAAPPRVDALAVSCLRLLDDEGLRRRLGRQAARRMRDQRSPRLLAQASLRAAGLV